MSTHHRRRSRYSLGAFLARRIVGHRYSLGAIPRDSAAHDLPRLTRQINALTLAILGILLDAGGLLLAHDWTHISSLTQTIAVSLSLVGIIALALAFRSHP